MPTATRPRDGTPQPLGMRPRPGACTTIIGRRNGRSFHRRPQAERSEQDGNHAIPSMRAGPAKGAPSNRRRRRERRGQGSQGRATTLRAGPQPTAPTQPPTSNTPRRRLGAIPGALAEAAVVGLRCRVTLQPPRLHASTNAQGGQPGATPAHRGGGMRSRMQDAYLRCRRPAGKVRG